MCLSVCVFGLTNGGGGGKGSLTSSIEKLDNFLVGNEALYACIGERTEIEALEEPCDWK